MEIIKKSIVGFSAILILAITISNIAFAHGGNDRSSPNNSNMGGAGMIGPSMMTDMKKMHSIMLNDNAITQNEFDWLKNKQEEHMGWSWMNSFESTDTFNDWRKPKLNSNREVMRYSMMR